MGSYLSILGIIIIYILFSDFIFLPVFPSPSQAIMAYPMRHQKKLVSPWRIYFCSVNSRLLRPPFSLQRCSFMSRLACSRSQIARSIVFLDRPKSFAMVLMDG